MSEDFDPGPPTHNLCIVRKGKKKTDVKQFFTQVGVGWQNDKGTIRIMMDPGCVLHWRDMDDMKVFVFPRKKEGTNDE